MDSSPVNHERVRDVSRILRESFDHGWEGFEFLESWDGHDLEALRAYLGDEEYQSLLDELGSEDEAPPPS